MKNVFAILVLFTAATSQAAVTNSQTNSSVNSGVAATAPTLWLNVGPGFAGTSTSSANAANADAGTGSRTGIAVGVEAEFPVSQMFSIRTGLDYLQKGTSTSISAGNISADQTFSLNYLELPVLAKANFLVGGNTLAISAGPYAALALSRSLSTQVNGVEQNTSTDATGFTKALDIGARFGAAFEMPIAETLAVSVGVNYDLGFTNVLNTDSDQVVDKTASAKNHEFAAIIGLGVKI